MPRGRPGRARYPYPYPYPYPYTYPYRLVVHHEVALEDGGPAHADLTWEMWGGMGRYGEVWGDMGR